MSLVRVQGLVKKYKNLTAVDHISLEVEEGTIFGMLGPNGAGKTTTIECMIGLRDRDAGEVEVLGYDPQVDYAKLYNQIGVQLQETSYQDKIKVFEVCDLFTSMYENPLDYRELLRQFDLHDKINSYLVQLSGGQRQKIAIILALISNPKLVFLDELTTGLDPKSRREMWEYIKGLKNEGRTIFMTTHYMEEAEYLCDRICIINGGKIIASDTVDGIIDYSNIDHIISFETDEDITELVKDGVTGINRIERVDQKIQIFSRREEILTDLVLFLKERDIRYRKIDIQRPNLEDAFIKLTKTSEEVA